MQRELLALFVHHDYYLSKHEMEEFSRNKNVFESQLINGINEIFFDVYDDMLILEEEGKYTINPEYSKSSFLKNIRSNKKPMEKSEKG
ncbi:tellurite resistance TerB C-terminal domain-containing protein [Acidobacteriota bacterium]